MRSTAWLHTRHRNGFSVSHALRSSRHAIASARVVGLKSDLRPDSFMTTWRTVRYWLYIGHRWLGICACLLFAIWFASGLVMSYVGYPEAQPARRYQAL